MRIAAWLAALCIFGLLAYALDMNGYDRAVENDCKPRSISNSEER